MDGDKTYGDDASLTNGEQPRAKAPWHAPTLEEVEYSATEAAGVGAVYDLTVYTGSV